MGIQGTEPEIRIDRKEKKKETEEKKIERRMAKMMIRYSLFLVTKKRPQSKKDIWDWKERRKESEDRMTESLYLTGKLEMTRVLTTINFTLRDIIFNSLVAVALEVLI